MNYYLDESGNAGDISLTKPDLSFGDQPIFALACIGFSDLKSLEKHISDLKKKYKIQAEELKMQKIYNKKPKFVKEVFQFIKEAEIPFFVEIVDKKYQLAINIVNNYVMPPYFMQPENKSTIFIRNVFSDFIYHEFPDSIFVDFLNIFEDPSNSKVVGFFNILINFLNKRSGEVCEGLLINIIESLDDYHKIEEKEGMNAYKKFLPIPDLNKREEFVWMLPHYNSFTNIYARINLYNTGDLSNIKLIHDEQKHFDEILKAAKSDVENLKDTIPASTTPNSNYNFTKSALLSFGDSQKSIGIQVADMLAGFLMRFTSDYIWRNEICSDKREAFDILFKCGDEKTSVGMNFVLSKSITSELFNSVK
ncbi:DUF3800 domain-containing protein [Acinetobacter baumannii]|uniref:DUF3800 domain-containing protein n=1 Tax=Acinetobacter baumannii TaxID=470 RepID=UPI003B842A8C